MKVALKTAVFGAFALISPLAQAAGAINPDVTQANIQQTICVPGYTKTVRPSTV